MSAGPGWTTINCLLALFVGPNVLVYFPGMPRRLGRAIAVPLFFVSVTSGLFWFALDPNIKFANTESEIDLVFHLIAVALGIWVCIAILLPLAADIKTIVVGEKPTRFRRVVSDIRAIKGGLVSLVRFSEGEPSYYLYFPIMQPEVGHCYEFEVLPRSRVILDFTL